MDGLFTLLAVLLVLGVLTVGLVLGAKAWKALEGRDQGTPRGPAVSPDAAPAETAPEPAASSPVHYSPQDSLLSTPERKAFMGLQRAIAGRGYVCPKVRIADLITPHSESRSAWQTAFNKISAKHVDFAVMARSGDILFAVEVDDSTHRDPRSQYRDEFVNAVFRQAGLPLIRLDADAKGPSEQLNALIADLWPAPEAKLTEPAQPAATAAAG